MKTLLAGPSPIRRVFPLPYFQHSLPRLLHSYVPIFATEFHDFIRKSLAFQGRRGEFDVVQVMAEITIFTASRSLQGKEVRQKFDSTFAELYYDLDMGFTPINSMLLWFPLLAKRRRD